MTHYESMQAMIYDRVDAKQFRKFSNR